MGVASNPASIAVIDDHEESLDACCLLLSALGWETVRFKNALDYVQAARSGLATSCVISDVVMEGMSGLALADVMSTLPNTGALILVSGQGTVSMAVEGLRRGAQHFLEKPLTADQLISAIKDAAEGQARPPVRSSNNPLSKLTNREAQVLDLICSGLSNSEAASQLGLSRRTVESYRATIMSKLQTPSLAALVSVYLSHR